MPRRRTLLTCTCGFALPVPATVVGVTFRCLRCGAPIIPAAPTAADALTIPDFGPGTELKALLASWGLTSKDFDGCGCDDAAREMDRLGSVGVREAKAKFIAMLAENAKRLNWKGKLSIASKLGAQWVTDAVAQRPWFNPLDPYGSLIDEAVRRAEAKDTVLPFDGPVTRNLIYHIGPFGTPGVWQRNLEQIRRRRHLFNGRRVATILTGEKMDPPDVVRREAAGLFDEMIEVPNDPQLREVVSFRALMPCVASLDRNTITFFAHAKGVTKPVNDGVSVHRWTDLMYETCLDYLPLAERLLQQFPVVGSFKRIGPFFYGSASQWHYSGTFYWFRSANVFCRQWDVIDAHWWGTESWPGLHFRVEQGGVLFAESADSDFDLYLVDFFNGVIEPQYADWQAAHAHERTEP